MTTRPTGFGMREPEPPDPPARPSRRKGRPKSPRQQFRISLAHRDALLHSRLFIAAGRARLSVNELVFRIVRQFIYARRPIPPAAMADPTTGMTGPAPWTNPIERQAIIDLHMAERAAIEKVRKEIRSEQAELARQQEELRRRKKEVKKLDEETRGIAHWRNKPVDLGQGMAPIYGDEVPEVSDVVSDDPPGGEDWRMPD